MTPLLLALLVEIHAVEARWQLPPLLLAAVCLHESRGRQRLVTPERGGCSVGAAQVYVPGCERARVQRLLVLSVNLDEGARILSAGRERCRRHPRWRMCRVHWVGAYNGGARGYAERVLRVWRRLVGARRRDSRTSSGRLRIHRRSVAAKSAVGMPNRSSLVSSTRAASEKTSRRCLSSANSCMLTRWPPNAAAQGASHDRLVPRRTLDRRRRRVGAVPVEGGPMMLDPVSMFEDAERRRKARAALLAASMISGWFPRIGAPPETKMLRETAEQKLQRAYENEARRARRARRP